METKTIDENGGEIIADELTLTIPASAFNSATEIKILSSTIDKPFDENHASKSYRIEGLPLDYKVPFKISIKYSNGPASSENLLAIGEEILSSAKYGYQFLESIDSNGYVVGELAVQEQYQISKSMKKIYDGEATFSPIFSTISGYNYYKSSQGHFNIYLPEQNINNANLISNILEDAYQKIIDLGFNYDARNWPIVMPIDVTFKKLEQGLDGGALRSKLGIYFGYMEMNQDLLNDQQRLQTTLGHEFFHIVQAFYDKRWVQSAYAWAVCKQAHFWFDEATAAWIEEKFTNVTNYFPEVRSGNEHAPFDKGMHWDPYIGVYCIGEEDASVQGHGYGLSALIKYLVTRYGEAILIKMYNDIKDWNVHPIEAICQEDPAEWWDEFLKEYMLGNVYNDVSIDDWLSGKEDNYQISSESDVSKTFTKNYQELSASIYYIRLNYPGINSNAEAVFTISGASKRNLTLFKFNSAKQIEYIASDKNKLVLKDLKTLTDNGWNIFAVVSNNRYSSPYTSEKEISLDMKIIQPLTFNRCDIDLEAIGHYTQSGVTDGVPYTYDYDYGFAGEGILVYGSFSGNLFTGTTTTTKSTYTITETITAELNEDRDMMISFTGLRDFLWDDGTTRNFHISGTNLPIYPGSDSGFQISGEETCDHITLTHDQQAAIGANWTMNSLECNSGSNITISFRTE